MTSIAIRPAALDALEHAAGQAALAETDLRAAFAREIARLEMERRRSWRRFNFLKALVAADAGAPDRDTSRRAQALAAVHELEWEADQADRPDFVEALEPLADAVYDERLLETVEAEGAQPQQVAFAAEQAAPREAGLLMALAAFEARFEEARGRPLAEQFDRYMPETPLVDF